MIMMNSNSVNSHITELLLAMAKRESVEMNAAFHAFRDKREQVKALRASASALLDEDGQAAFDEDAEIETSFLRETEHDALFVADAVETLEKVETLLREAPKTTKAERLEQADAIRVVIDDLQEHFTKGA